MNQTQRPAEFFLGTTTPTGFKGYFDTLWQESGRRMYLIKSGPGCGKSTLMRQLAAKTDGEVELIHCSSDPDSLDGVILRDKNAAVVDATAPHTLEPAAPGARERVISLYHTLDNDRLQAHQTEIDALFAQNRQLRCRAARYIASAGGLLLDSRRAAACSTDFEKVRAYTKRLAARLLPPTGEAGCEQQRFLSGITPKGPLFYANTVTALASRQIVAFQDEYGAAARLIMELLRDEAVQRGYRVIVCHCAMHPEDKIDHLLIPALELAFVTSNSWHPARFPGQKNVRCSRFTDMAHLANFRSRLRFNRKAAAELIGQAVQLMAQAKACHDELENYYRPAVDFAAVSKAGAQLAEELR
ncbi:MAG: hypothetical protein IJ347_04245 [Faecalibacterium sp.]|nr:hypothetical protein [Faecalibacterium sp.]